jgi:DNA-binding NtrC family response regulator
LVADDEESIRTLLNWVLQQQGFRVWLAPDGREAVQIYQEQYLAIALVLLDLDMPGLNGPETAVALQPINPAVRWCFMSGGGNFNDEAGLSHGGALHFFAKPFDPFVVAQTLWDLVSGTADD